MDAEQGHAAMHSVPRRTDAQTCTGMHRIHNHAHIHAEEVSDLSQVGQKYRIYANSPS